MSASTPQSDYRLLAVRVVPSLVILLTLVILGGTLFSAGRHFRETVREQIAGRDARILHALWLSHPFDGAEDSGLAHIAETPADQLEAILEITKLPPASGAIATRLFDTNGNFLVAFPWTVSSSRLTAEELRQLKELIPTSRFIPAARLSDLSPAPPNMDRKLTRPLLEITIPLHAQDQDRLLGIAQLVKEGESIAAEYAALDRTVLIYSVGAFLGSGAIVVLVLGLAFQQLGKVNRLLLERTKNLLQANQELTWAAKASAIGAVTSHLIHGLKNPLSGLQNFMVGLNSESPATGDTEWKLAMSTTRRMQGLVNEVVRILREQGDTVQYEISLDELIQIITAKMTPFAQQVGVQFHSCLRAEGMLANRDANLIILVLENLIHNAIQATPRGKAVTLGIESAGETMICEVRDEGPGLPEHRKGNLFKPCQSAKEQGSGIGLAISKQLASSIGADLELKSSTPHGCIFVLAVPEKLLTAKTEFKGQATVG